MNTLTFHTQSSHSPRIALVNLLPALLVLLCAVFATTNARAATFTVTTTADSGAGSLRQAILNANNTPAADTINFNIAGAGIKVISPLTALPSITAPLTIDGYSQPGAKPNTLPVGTNAVILIRLDGAAAGINSGLFVNADVCTIKGLSITRFGFVGINVHSNYNTIAGNFIGVDPLGKAEEGGVSFGNDNSGVLIFDGNNNIVGGTALSARNLISNNTKSSGVYVQGTSVDTVHPGQFDRRQRDGDRASPQLLRGFRRRRTHHHRRNRAQHRQCHQRVRRH
jgi:hypothetical protein